jgi:hypothetical protein
MQLNGVPNGAADTGMDSVIFITGCMYHLV